MDLDTFFVSVERLIDSRLNGKPIMVGGSGDRGVVAACSYEARAYGVTSGMSMKMARMMCPEAMVIRGDTGIYTKHSKLVTEIMKQDLPILEKASVDEFYADMTGMDKHFGCYQYASEVRQRVMRETGLPISFGLSSSKVVAKVATGEAKPNNQLKIDYGAERPFLAPLSIKKIPMIGDKTFQTLCNLGIKRVHTIQEMPAEMMEGVLGKNGRMIWQRANAIDNSPVIEYQERKSISSERTFGKDTIDMTQLRTTISAMAENLAYLLRQGGKLTSCITVKIRYSDFNTYSKQVRVPYTSADHVIMPKVLEIFESLFARRLLVRLVGVRCSGLVEGCYQMSLFDNLRQTVQLYAGMDKVRKKYGDRSVMRASTLGARTIGNQGNPFDGSPPILLAHRHH